MKNKNKSEKKKKKTKKTKIITGVMKPDGLFITFAFFVANAVTHPAVVETKKELDFF